MLTAVTKNRETGTASKKTSELLELKYNCATDVERKNLMWYGKEGCPGQMTRIGCCTIKDGS